MSKDDDKLRMVAISAAAIIGGIYEWVDMVNDAGGCTSIEGVAKCNAMLKSLNENRGRIDDTVLKPLSECVEPRT